MLVSFDCSFMEMEILIFRYHLDFQSINLREFGHFASALNKFHFLSLMKNIFVRLINFQPIYLHLSLVILHD